MMDSEEHKRSRTKEQNELMWAGPLKDIETQVFFEGRMFERKVWHEQFKEWFLPEQFDPELTKAGYVKWQMMPNGRMQLVGSTTELTVKGFSDYLEQIYAFGAERGVEFHAVPRLL